MPETIAELEATLSTMRPDLTVEELEAAVAELRPRGTRIRLYFSEGEQTNDHRVIDIGSINFSRPAPWALTYQRTRPAEGGHANAEIAGVLEAAARDGNVIVVEGRIDLGSEAGSELERQIYEGFISTWSPDLSEAVIDVEELTEDEDSNLDSPVEQLAHFRKATFNGATVVAMPALASAVIELLDDDGNVIKPAPKREVDTAQEPKLREEIVERQVASGGAVSGNGPYLVGERGPELFIPHTNGSVVSNITINELHNPADTAAAISNRISNDLIADLSACAGPKRPPPSFFTNPKFTELTRHVVITADGRFSTHVASYDECHIGYLDRCITIREIADCRGEGNFEHAKIGFVMCSDGSKVETGPITIKGGHAPKGLSAMQALAHYDDPDAAFADVVYGMDNFGCWASGRIRPTATEYQIDIARASGVSLDARAIGGKLRYLATCAVNTPGFTKAHARLAASADGDLDIIELVAAGGRPQPAKGDCGCGCNEPVLEVVEDNRLDTVLDILASSGITSIAIDALESSIRPTSVDDV